MVNAVRDADEIVQRAVAEGNEELRRFHSNGGVRIIKQQRRLVVQVYENLEDDAVEVIRVDPL